MSDRGTAWNTEGKGSFLDGFGLQERSGLGARSHQSPSQQVSQRRQPDDRREALLTELAVLRQQHESMQRQQQHHQVQVQHQPLPSVDAAKHAPRQAGPMVFDPDMFGNNTANPRQPPQHPHQVHQHQQSQKPHQQEREDVLVLGQSDKDAIEALFKTDDFAEQFNAGGNISRLPPSVAKAGASPTSPHAAQLSRDADGRRAQPPQQQRNQQQQQRQPVRSAEEGGPFPVCRVCCKKLAPQDIAAYVNKSFDPSKPTPRRKKQ